MEPLRAFIISRELEDALPEKVAALRRFEGKSELHFSDVMSSSLRFRWDGKKTLAEIVLRESGDCDVEAIDLKTGSISPHQYKRCVSKEDFYGMFAEFVATVTANEKRA
jgi:hypothetical protein